MHGPMNVKPLGTSNLAIRHLLNDHTLVPLEVTSFTKSREAKNKQVNDILEYLFTLLSKP